MKQFKEILAKPKAFDRCDGVYCLLAELTENKLNAEGEPEPLRTISLVWFSNGIIGNGGFGYLFMADLPGDPGYVYTAASYAHIGARNAYSAFSRALALFPGNSPPRDVHERRRLFDSFDKTQIDAIEADFYRADQEIETCLDEFIRMNAEEIERKIAEAEQQGGGYSPPAARSAQPAP